MVEINHQEIVVSTEVVAVKDQKEEVVAEVVKGQKAAKIVREAEIKITEMEKKDRNIKAEVKVENDIGKRAIQTKKTDRDTWVGAEVVINVKVGVEVVTDITKVLESAAANTEHFRVNLLQRFI